MSFDPQRLSEIDGNLALRSMNGLLVIREAMPDSESSVHAFRHEGPVLEYEFVQGKDGFLDKEMAAKDNGIIRYRVSERWRPLGADFRQQVLNIPFTDALLSFRPVAIRVEQLTGCTLDLPRIAELLCVSSIVVLPFPENLPVPQSRAARWLSDTLAMATSLEFPPGISDLAPYAPFTDRIPVTYGSTCMPSQVRSTTDFAVTDYALYEFLSRDHALIWEMQKGHVNFFAGCRNVLDVGAGAGIFLDQLHSSGVQGAGVDRCPEVVRYAQGLGLDVVEADALDYLEQHRGVFDGVYCSHFIEHLPVSGVERLLRLINNALVPGGRLVLVFPDPESIRSQLLGFWRDPEHVRFYHPDLVVLMARVMGLECIYHGHRVGNRDVVSFPPGPSIDISRSDLPALDDLINSESSVQNMPQGWKQYWQHILRFLGIASLSDLNDLRLKHDELLSRIKRQQDITGLLIRRNECLSEDVRLLWKVNQTWSWDDNAVVVFRKRSVS